MRLRVQRLHVACVSIDRALQVLLVEAVENVWRGLPLGTSTREEVGELILLHHALAAHPAHLKLRLDLSDAHGSAVGAGLRVRKLGIAHDERRRGGMESNVSRWHMGQPRRPAAATRNRQQQQEWKERSHEDG